jgi:hypothetical protein
MTDPRGIVDFFALEAGEYLERMDAWLAGAAGSAFGGPPDVEPFVRSARALRGAAAMARQQELAALAEALGRVGGALQQGRLAWNAGAAETLTAAVEAFRRLLRSTRAWSAGDSAEAQSRMRRLHGLLGAAAQGEGHGPHAVVPIRALAPDDGEDHVVRRAPAPPITGDQRFRQAAVPLASALRRAIGEAQRSSARDDAARLTLGEDLRAALRDLRDLAESYDVRPVVNFCAAREASLAALDERALDTVDGAAAALIESAGATWARVTPSSGVHSVTGPSGRTPARPQPSVAAAPATPAPATPAPAVAEPRVAIAAEPAAAPKPAPVAPPPVPAPEPVAASSPVTREIGAPVLGAPVIADVAGRPATTTRPPSGAALVALLETGISGMASLSASLAGGTLDEPVAPVAPPLRTEASVAAAPDVVPIDRLVYRGPAALERARAVRDELRAAPRPPDDALLDELFDLLDLIAVD